MIGKITDVDEDNKYQYCLDDIYWCEEDELELVEEEPEKTFGQEMDNLISNIIDEITNNPTGAMVKLGKLAIDKDKEIEDLKTELKNKQSRIDYLEGQISVYKKYMFSESEEN